ncbi:SIS domain-containing protein [Caldifermentibacillus hisashii]|uniref:SIS domain-containing protein n=1 Tax=Caldifermentibacillus hisashii TaxID=996558 RepID=UPI002E2262C6|nr:SIS domain-containing protein [Caldifermentibacillus hisashii]
MNQTNHEVKTFLDTVNSELDKFQKQIDYHSLERARDLILKAEKKYNRIHVTGIGKPGHVAGYIASLLSSTGTPAYTLHGTEAVHGSSGQVCPGDVVIAISNSGETLELKATVEALIKNGAIIVSVTGKKDSWLAKHSEVVLVAGVENEGDYLNKPPRASIIAEILILQSLSILLQDAKGITPLQYSKWHPGGAIGQSIKNGK